MLSWSSAEASSTAAIEPPPGIVDQHIRLEPARVGRILEPGLRPFLGGSASITVTGTAWRC